MQKAENKFIKVEVKIVYVINHLKETNRMREPKDIIRIDEEIKAATDKQILQAEEKLGVQLPNCYKEIVKVQDGGYFVNDTFLTKFPTSWADDHIQITELYGISSYTSILHSAYLIEEWDLPKNLVVISGDGHLWIALDYRQSTAQSSVLLIDIDGAGIRELAPNLEAFLNDLTTDADVELDEEFLAEDEETFDECEEYEGYTVLDWDEYILYEAKHLTDEIKSEWATEARVGRSNEEIKREIDEVIVNGTTNQLADCFGRVLQLFDAEVERYIIGKILHHKSVKIREAVAEHLAACAIRGFDTLAKNDVEVFLMAMKEKERNEHNLWLIEQGVMRLR